MPLNLATRPALLPLLFGYSPMTLSTYSGCDYHEKPRSQELSFRKSGCEVTMSTQPDSRSHQSRHSLSRPRRASSRASGPLPVHPPSRRPATTRVYRRGGGCPDQPHPHTCAWTRCSFAAQSLCSRCKDGNYAHAWSLINAVVRACWVREFAAFNSLHGVRVNVDSRSRIVSLM